MCVSSLNRLGAHCASCKQWSALLATAVLLAGAIARLPLASMLWAATPILLLGLVEAACAAQERRHAEALKGKRAEESSVVLPPEPAGESIVRTAVAALSPGIWPFYLGLFAIVGFGAGSMNAPSTPAATAARGGGCGSGGCGSAGGCGTSGCGASSGRACGCTGAAASSAQTRSVPPSYGPVAAPGAPRPAFVPVNVVQPNRPAAPPAQRPIVPAPVRSSAGPTAAPGTQAAPKPGPVAPGRPAAAPQPSTVAPAPVQSAPPPQKP